MKNDKLKNFPEGFFWGASTSAYQCEGANCEDGKGPSCQDIKELPQGTSDLSVCSDFYHKYKDYIRLMAEMGLKSYRFSIAWSRILPDGTGAVNPKGIQFYNDVINECLKYNIEPIVTMFHFDMPAALDRKGGWSRRDSVDWFLNYSKVLFLNYGDRVRYWLTINEQNMLTLIGPVIGTLQLPADCQNMVKEIYQQNHHMLVAQAKSMKLCHELLPNATIGPAPNISLAYPETCKPEDVIAAQNLNAVRNWLYLDIAVYGRYNNIVSSYLESQNALPDIAPGDMAALAEARPDFLGINYYNTATVSAYNPSLISDEKQDQQGGASLEGMYSSRPNPWLEKTPFGWTIDPVGFRATLREIYGRYHLPVLITENGIGAYDTLTDDGKIHDDYRIDYYMQHLKQLRLAISDGVDVIGYNPWSACDLISTHDGMKKRYGFIYVDRDEFDLRSMDLYRKDSFYWYKETIKNNGNNIK